MKTLSLHCLNTGLPEPTIKTLLAAKAITKHLIAGDVANSDELKSFCAVHKIPYYKLSVNDSLADCQNVLVNASETQWHMHLMPGETVKNPGKIIDAIQGEAAVYRLPCVAGEWLSKDVRVYNKAVGVQFSNPVFESIEYDRAGFVEAYVVGGGGVATPHTERLLVAWQNRQPLSVQPRYYTTLTYLMEGKQAAFINAAKSYLFTDQMPCVSNVMLRYYLACALMNKPQTRKEAAKHVMTCLAANVLMAEFWCLLGDMCFVDSSFERAKAFYRNAMVLGSRRLKDDPWPMHIPKYKKQPQTMIDACNEAAAESRTFTSSR